MKFVSAAHLTGGGTITGDLTISGDLTVSGEGGFAYSEVLEGNLSITQTADQATGIGLYVSRDLAASATNSPLVKFVNDSASDDQTALYIQQDGTGNALHVVQTLAGNLNGTMARFFNPSQGDGNYTYLTFGKSTESDEAGILGFTLESSNSRAWLSVIGDDGDGGVGLTVKKGGNVGIGTAAPATLLHLESTDDNEPILQIKTTHAGNHGGMLKFSKISASEADDDELGDIGWYGYDSGNNETRYGLIRASSTDITNGDEGGKIQFYVHAGGTAGTAADKELFSIGGEDVANGTACAVVINEAGIDSDFRVEASGEANALFVQGSDGKVGIGTASPNNTLVVAAESTTEGGTLGLGIYDSTIVDGNKLGTIVFMGTEDGSTWGLGAKIHGEATQTWANNTAEGTALVFSTSPESMVGSAVSERLRIDHNGNVGIGTTAPAALLDVGGGSVADPTVLIDSASGGDPQLIFDTGASNRTAIIGFKDEGTAIGYIKYQHSGDKFEFYAGSSSSKQFVIDNNSRISLSNNDSSNTENTIFGFDCWNNSSNNGSDYNTLFGHQCFKGGAVAGAERNAAFGHAALYSITDGDSNTAVGSEALWAITSGSQNVAIGRAAGDAMTSQSNCVLIGMNAGTAINHDDANGTTIVGRDAGEKLTSGIGTTALGYGALTGNHTGDYNTAIGYESAKGVTDNAHSNNVSVGYRSLYAVTTGSNNVAIGYLALDELTNSGDNVAVGAYALNSCDAGEGGNVAIGYAAGSEIDSSTADNNVIIGTSAGIGGAAAMAECVAIGYLAMNSTAANAQTGTVAIGSNSLTALTTGARNVAVGYNAGLELVTSNDCTLIGYQAGEDINDTGFGVAGCTYVGSYSGKNLDDGTHNTALGFNAMVGTTGGSSCNLNVAIGKDALESIKTGDQNVVIGADAGDATVDVDNTVIIGYSAGGSVMTDAADGTVAIGKSALAALTSGAGNTAVGYQVGQEVTTGEHNTLLGYQAGLNMDGDEDNNVLIGYQSGTVIDNGNNNTLVGCDTDVDDVAATNRTAIGYGVVADYDNSVVLGNADVDDIYMGYDKGATVHCSVVSANGVSFPPTQSASGGANILDDYEEGTWTPVLVSGSTTITRSGGNENATYTKIGNQVTVQWSFRDITTAGSFENASTNITGLPFTAGDPKYAVGSVFSIYGNTSFSAIAHFTRVETGTASVFLATQSATTYAGVEVDAVGSGTYGGFTMTYWV